MKSEKLRVLRNVTSQEIQAQEQSERCRQIVSKKTWRPTKWTLRWGTGLARGSLFQPHHQHEYDGKEENRYHL